MPVRAGARRQKEKRKSAETFSMDHDGLVLQIGDFRSFSLLISLLPSCSSLLIQTNQFRTGTVEAKGRGSSKRKVMRLHQEV